MAAPITKRVLPGQSIWDFALQHLGAMEGAEQLIRLNKINFNDSLAAGTELVIGDIINQKTVDAFEQVIIKPASAVNNAVVLPRPPYVRLANAAEPVTTITMANYAAGATPSTFLAKVIADGLMPADGNITFTPGNNIETSVDNGRTWSGLQFTIPYIGGYVDTGLIYLIRFKDSLNEGTYTDTLTLSGANAATITVNIRVKITGIVYHPVAQAYFDHAFVMPSIGYKTKYNDFILGLDEIGAVYELDLVQIYGTGNKQNACINIIHPTWPVAMDNSTPWLADKGYETSLGYYIDTNFNPATQGIKYTGSSAFIGFYGELFQTSFGYAIGATGTSTSFIVPVYSGGVWYAMNATGAGLGTSFTNMKAFYSIWLEPGASYFKLYQNDTLLGTYSVNGPSAPDAKIFIGTKSNNNTPDASYYNARFSMIMAGSGNIDKTQISNKVNQAATAFGW